MVSKTTKDRKQCLFTTHITMFCAKNQARWRDLLQTHRWKCLKRLESSPRVFASLSLNSHKANAPFQLCEISLLFVSCINRHHE